MILFPDYAQNNLNASNLQPITRIMCLKLLNLVNWKSFNRQIFRVFKFKLLYWFICKYKQNCLVLKSFEIHIWKVYCILVCCVYFIYETQMNLNSRLDGHGRIIKSHWENLPCSGDAGGKGINAVHDAGI